MDNTYDFTDCHPKVRQFLQQHCARALLLLSKQSTPPLNQIETSIAMFSSGLLLGAHIAAGGDGFEPEVKEWLEDLLDERGKRLEEN